MADHDSNLWQLACHEAGHAVVAKACGLSVPWVHIRSVLVTDPDGSVYLEGGKTLVTCTPDEVARPEVVFSQLASWTAGLVGERLGGFVSTREDHGFHGDVEGLLSMFGGDLERFENLLGLAVEKANQILRRNRRAHRLVSLLLRDLGLLHGDDLASLWAIHGA